MAFVLNTIVIPLEGESAGPECDGESRSSVIKGNVRRHYGNPGILEHSCTPLSEILADCLSGNSCSRLNGVGKRQGPGPSSSSVIVSG